MKRAKGIITWIIVGMPILIAIGCFIAAMVDPSISRLAMGKMTIFLSLVWLAIAMIALTALFVTGLISNNKRVKV